MNRILYSDWLLDEERWPYLACSELLSVSRKKIVFFLDIVNPSLSSQDDLILASSFVACLWTSTSSGSIDTQKRPPSSHFDWTSLVNNLHVTGEILLLTGNTDDG